MAYTGIDALNIVLKRTGDIQGSAGELSSFTDSTRQRSIDVALQVINETIDYLYSLGVLAGEVTSSSITLAEDTREYALASDFIGFAGKDYFERVFTNTSNNRRLYEYPGGYTQMFLDQPDASDYQGDPSHWALTNASPQRVRLDTTPQSEQDGDVYNYLYETRITIDDTTDTFPFDDQVFDGLAPFIADLVKSDLADEARKNDWSSRAIITAIKTIRQKGPRRAWGVERVG